MQKWTVQQIANLCEAQVEGPSGCGERVIRGLAPLAEAGSEHATFLGDIRYRDGLQSTEAGCVLIGKDVEPGRDGLVLLRCADPSGAFSKLVEAFAPSVSRPEPGVHPSSVVHPSASVAPDASVGPLCVIGEGARIESGAVLVSQVSVGPGVVVGEGTVLHPQVVLYPGTRLGERCILHGGSVIGSDGFGFQPTPEGWVKIRQGGGVRIENDVEIGAGCTIDCARFGETWIGPGCKLDNLIHVGHNVRIGAHSLLIAQSGVAGSTHLGSRVILAGQSGVGGHLKLGDGARVGAGSKVLSDLAGDQDYFGYPAGPKEDTLRGLAFLPKMRAEFKKLKARIRKLEQPSETTERASSSQAAIPEGSGDPSEPRS